MKSFGIGLLYVIAFLVIEALWGINIVIIAGFTYLIVEMHEKK